MPATTANLGPGFDCLGMALDLWNELEVEFGEDAEVFVEGQGSSELPSDRTNLVYSTMEYLFVQGSVRAPKLRVHCYNQIPLKRGLGSSAAAIIGGLMVADLLLSRMEGSEGRCHTKEELLNMAAHLEGHPDNVAAALLGGLQLVAREDDTLLSAQVPIPDEINAVLYIPEMTIATERARAVLPDSVSREDAVYSMGRTALLVNALAAGRLEHLRVATRDRLHQPYRQKLFPAMKVIFEAALKAGALGVFLSGSGSTILALTAGREMTVAYEMAEAARQTGITGNVKVTRPTNLGAHQVDDAS